MEPTLVPNLILLGSCTLASVSYKYYVVAIRDIVNSPRLVREQPTFFNIWTLLPNLCFLSILVWTFFHASWWEPILTLGFATLFSPMFAGQLFKLVGDMVYALIFLLSAPLSVALLCWAFGWL